MKNTNKVTTISLSTAKLKTIKSTLCGFNDFYPVLSLLKSWPNLYYELAICYGVLFAVQRAEGVVSSQTFLQL
jgi:hypothetical protein